MNFGLLWLIFIICAKWLATYCYYFNLRIYESVQKFGGLITSGKITNNESDVQKIAQLLLEARAFYDAEMIAQIINSILRSSSHHQHAMSNNKKPTIDTVAASEVTYVMRQLKTAGIPIS